MAVIYGFRDLIVYQKAFKLAMQVFDLSKKFPAEEKYSLTDQIRRSSRSVATNIAEAWAKRSYEKHFVSKLSDSKAEEYETGSWLDFSLEFRYLESSVHQQMIKEYEEVRKMLISMMSKPEKFTKP